jgi:hypothetical protein
LVNGTLGFGFVLIHPLSKIANVTVILFCLSNRVSKTVVCPAVLPRCGAAEVLVNTVVAVVGAEVDQLAFKRECCTLWEPIFQNSSASPGRAR